jgi:6,7-dimethyl-8-ribityllumazine synthase
MTIYEYKPRPTDEWIAIAVAKFNAEITEKLLHGAVKALHDHGVADTSIDVVRVPGAFELPLTAKRLAESGKYAAVIALGAVIRGDTDHYDYVCQAAMHGLLHAGLDVDLPVIFGVLTCNTEAQALARAGGTEGNKGADAALAALEMINVLDQLSWGETYE